MYLHTHTHRPLCCPVRPKAGWFLQTVYFGILPFCCQSSVFILSSRCLPRLYGCVAGFYSTSSHLSCFFFFFIVFLYLCIHRTWTSVCPCRPTSGYLTVTWRNCSWAARPSTSRWADAPAEHRWWGGREGRGWEKEVCDYRKIEGVEEAAFVF